jgi:hypothetical protein
MSPNTNSTSDASKTRSLAGFEGHPGHSFGGLLMAPELLLPSADA